MAQDTFKALREFTPFAGKKGRYYALAALEQAGLGKISRLPRSIRVHVLAGAGHMPQMEKAGDVNAFIEELDTGSA